MRGARKSISGFRRVTNNVEELRGRRARRRPDRDRERNDVTYDDTSRPIAVCRHALCVCVCGRVWGEAGPGSTCMTDCEWSRLCAEVRGTRKCPSADADQHYCRPSQESL